MGLNKNCFVFQPISYKCHKIHQSAERDQTPQQSLQFWLTNIAAPDA